MKNLLLAYLVVLLGAFSAVIRTAAGDKRGHGEVFR